ncbi:MAG: DUF4175 family protein [Bryobacterales bacterium]|nr:hypothetical protein [Bryobacteraceae bacterium]MDW8353439.1 DUF4175 family protein [Bryobacterales bacterium]
MSWVEHLDRYLRDLERRFRLAVVLRGAAIAAAVALAATVLLALLSNALAFSERSLAWSRLLLFLVVALAIGFAWIVPAMAVNRRRSARMAEQRVAGFEQRLLTLAEARLDPQADPFLELVAADAAPVAQQSPPATVVPSGPLLAWASAGAASVAMLVWLVLSGPGFLGYGAAMLWAGHLQSGTGPFYAIQVEPGNRTVRRGGTQQITARPVGFQPDSVRLFARYRGVTKWEEAPMLPVEGSTAYAFVFAGIPETVDYYVAAGKVRSKTFTLSVKDLPTVKRIRVTYRYPAWTGLPVSVEDPGGDLRAVQGTEVEIAVHTDRALSGGVLALEDGREIPLESDRKLWASARLRLDKDGAYYVAVREQGELVRLSDDYFIEAQKDAEPAVRITRPGRDARVSPIEEVTIAVEAGDDFGLQDVTLYYAVNGGPERTVPLLKTKGAREAQGVAVLALEDFKLVPGDVVAIYATARDARATTRTDIFFLEAQPFEREFTQSQQMAGGGAMEGAPQSRISQRQKEIIAATWNQLRAPGDRQQAAENAKFLSETQARLRDQVRSLSGRMQRRQLSVTNQEFQSFADDMEKAAQAMEPAVEKLRAGQWREALPHEQKALQHLLRAEATFRHIQVAFSSWGGGGVGARDLESLFDLELDTEKNQYETGQSAASAEQRDREMEEALRRLEELARRQQELAATSRHQQLALQQRWQQELLRREAEQLQRRMEELVRGSPGPPSGESPARQTADRSSGEGRSPAGRSGTDPRVEQALRRLQEATEAMRRARSSSSRESTGDEARRAAQQLREAAELMRGLRQQEASGRVDRLARQAEQLARDQRDFEQRVRELDGTQGEQPGNVPSLRPGGTSEQARQARALAEERRRMLEDLQRLEQELKHAIRDLAGTDRATAARLREALAGIQDQEVALRMRQNAELLRRGMGAFVSPREGPITRALEQLRDQLEQARASVGGSSQNQSGLESAMRRLERLRQEAEQLARQQAARSGAAEGRGRQSGATGQREAERGDSGPLGGNREGAAWERSRWHTGGPGEVHSAWNVGDLIPPAGRIQPRSGTAADLERWRRDSLRDLTALRQDLREYPEAERELQELIRLIRHLDPSRFPGNPQLLSHLETQILPLLGHLEIQMRRQLEEKTSGSVRISSSEPPPPGYAEAVAEYFRRLSRGR